jgi:2-oxoacid:acceptor oxidoreductase gamma subunit (pyruvate/2-ketoisovalerate family)
MIAVSIHGRSGQGVETAVSALSKAVFSSGFYVQSVFFPAQERRGSHVWGLVKIDKNPVLSKQIEQPDMALIFSCNLDVKAIASGVKERGFIIFNSPEKIVTTAMKRNRVKSYFVNAAAIGLSVANKPMPNMAMLGAFVKCFGKISLKSVKSSVEYLGKEQTVAVEEGFKAVK